MFSGKCIWTVSRKRINKTEPLPTIYRQYLKKVFVIPFSLIRDKFQGKGKNHKILKLYDPAVKFITSDSIYLSQLVNIIKYRIQAKTYFVE